MFEKWFGAKTEASEKTDHSAEDIVWSGNWKENPPEGYVSTSDRYEALKAKGFDIKAVLGGKYVGEYKLRRTAAEMDGFLSRENLDKLLEMNRTVIKAMDDFEATLQKTGK
ncbi:MAG: hypothetical protein PHV93_04405 [Candidatus Pacebacteria bacterium]|nr:hypothetical protein [Candidatus Paceibacterota bacterium]